ncbi:Fcf2-domain-containing protein [Aulographum hederae CBS 113979]|uniref:Fcf2-domain-containing protein n=1 Tax=Aulographum hederae CBS 113979 TaxID=1176131 RepID=A0A6G1GYN8_9PEZI|nr:Fcf2-domain-containing protein [Aulographum hederae CBS 113979]
MAVPTQQSVGLHAHDADTFYDSDDLSDEQIQTLLQEAETRIREKQTAAENHSAAAIRIPKLKAGELAKPYVTKNGEVAIADQTRLLDNEQRLLSNKPRRVEDPVVVQQKKIAEKKATAGADWFNLPKTELTPEFKRDFQLMKMRAALDPHRHYKKENAKAVPPPFAQVGTIIEGSTEYFSARVHNKDRKRTFVDEVLASENSTGRLKRKYAEIQATKTSGKKAHYKALMAKRQKKKW